MGPSTFGVYRKCNFVKVLRAELCSEDVGNYRWAKDGEDRPARLQLAGNAGDERAVTNVSVRQLRFKNYVISQ